MPTSQGRVALTRRMVLPRSGIPEDQPRPRFTGARRAGPTTKANRVPNKNTGTPAGVPDRHARWTRRTAARTMGMFLPIPCRPGSEPAMAHLLLIDDDPAHVPGQVRQAFPAPDHRVEVAGTGARGLARVAAGPP